MSIVSLYLPPLPYYRKTEYVVCDCGSKQYAVYHPKNIEDKIATFNWIFVTQGELIIMEEQSKMRLEAGHAVLLLPNQLYHLLHGDLVSYYRVQFEFLGQYEVSTEHVDNIHKRNVLSDERQLLITQYNKCRQFSRVKQLLEQMQQLDHDQFNYWNSQQRFIDMLGLLECEELQEDPLTSVKTLAEQTERFLRLNFHKEISNETIAEALHFHSNYVSRCMKKIYGCTPLEYLHKLRLEHAKMLLAKTKKSVAAVAEHVGFKNAPYFTKCFQRYTGITPTSFRKKHLITMGTDQETST